MFQSYQPREALSESLSVPDVHLISLRPALEGLIVPSKYYGIAAAGRPAIFIGDPDGEIARILKESDTGIVVAEGDGPALMRAVRDLASNPERCEAMGRRARGLFEAKYDIAFAVEAWEEAISSPMLR
jgi:glycosyltransferase involved in cell wall biosynthesis